VQVNPRLAVDDFPAHNFPPDPVNPDSLLRRPTTLKKFAISDCVPSQSHVRFSAQFHSAYIKIKLPFGAKANSARTVRSNPTTFLIFTSWHGCVWYAKTSPRTTLSVGGASQNFSRCNFHE